MLVLQKKINVQISFYWSRLICFPCRFLSYSTNMDDVKEVVPWNSTLMDPGLAVETGLDVKIISVVAGISGISLLSQLPIIPIGMGLEGNFSAKTLIVVQAVMEINRRATATYLALCGSIGKLVA